MACGSLPPQPLGNRMTTMVMVIDIVMAIAMVLAMAISMMIVIEIVIAMAILIHDNNNKHDNNTTNDNHDNNRNANIKTKNNAIHEDDKNNDGRDAEIIILVCFNNDLVQHQQLILKGWVVKGGIVFFAFVLFFCLGSILYPLP